MVEECDISCVNIRIERGIGVGVQDLAHYTICLNKPRVRIT